MYAVIRLMTPQYWLRTVQWFRHSGMSKILPLKKSWWPLPLWGLVSRSYVSLFGNVLLFLFLSHPVYQAGCIAPHWSELIPEFRSRQDVIQSSLFILQGFVVSIGTFSRRRGVCMFHEFLCSEYLECLSSQCSSSCETHRFVLNVYVLMMSPGPA